jgi:hypothetical protein
VLNKTVVVPHGNGPSWSYTDPGGFYADKILEARVVCANGINFLEAQVAIGGGQYGLFLAYSAEPAGPVYVGKVLHFTSGSDTATITILSINA